MHIMILIGFYESAMKVLIDCDTPFALAHGGMQVQIEQTLAALPVTGIHAETLRWWDDRQRGDILHQFGLLSEGAITLARNQGMKTVMTLLLSQTCNRNWLQLGLRKLLVALSKRLPNWQGIGRHPVWASCQACDHIVVGLEAEKRIVTEIYGVSASKVSTLPLGLPEAFLKAAPATRDGGYLISVGTIAPVKRSVELARLAHKAEVPILFVGKPFESNNDYWKEFISLIDGRWVRHQPHVSSEAELLQFFRSACGFVLMSHYENWSFVAHEATACGLPLLLMDLPWSRERFGDQAHYFPKSLNEDASTAALKAFQKKSFTLPSPNIQLYSWLDVAQRLKQIYESLPSLTCG